jgi:hemerythrin
MAFFEWNDSYSVNIKEIDQQHRTLVELINQLYELTKRDNSRNTIASAVDELDNMAAVLDELADYTSNHFSTEEHYMLEYGYPEYARHKLAHRKFADRIQAFIQDFNDGKAIFSVEILEYLKDWWKQHILTVDREYGPFFNGRGLR